MSIYNIYKFADACKWIGMGGERYRIGISVTELSLNRFIFYTHLTRYLSIHNTFSQHLRITSFYCAYVV